MDGWMDGWMEGWMDRGFATNVIILYCVDLVVLDWFVIYHGR